jgi:hypothetical protein
MRRFAGNADQSTTPTPEQTASDHSSVHETLRAIPALLDGASLPNGVVELLIEDFEVPTRQLFDIQDGRVTLIDPGERVPWASIAGSPLAWTMALGPERNPAQLRLTGDERLARRVLAALPPAQRSSPS